MRHKKEDGTIFTLAEVVAKAKAWESAHQTNQRVIESTKTVEQVNYTMSRQNDKKYSKFSRQSSRPVSRNKGCGYCGGEDRHGRSSCPAAWPGVYCHKCYGRNHFAPVCKNERDKYKLQWENANKTSEVRHSAHQSQRESSGDSDQEFQYALSVDVVPVHTVGPMTKKLFTKLSLSLSGSTFFKVPFQVDKQAYAIPCP